MEFSEKLIIYTQPLKKSGSIMVYPPFKNLHWVSVCQSITISFLLHSILSIFWLISFIIRVDIGQEWFGIVNW